MALDEFYSSVSLLLHCDGANNSTTFTDNSSAARTVTPHGNAKISTTVSKFGGASAFFDGTGDYLTVASATALQLGSSDFTIELDVYLTGYSANQSGSYFTTLLAKDVSGNRSYNLSIFGTASSYTSIAFYGYSDNTTSQNVTQSFTFNLNTQYHVEVVRSGNLVYLFVDGTLLNTGGTSFTTTIQNTTNDLVIGAQIYDATYLGYTTGYVDELRLTKGVARHTAGYTIPTEAYPDQGFPVLSGISSTAATGTAVADFQLGISGISSTSANGSVVYLLSPPLTGISSAAATGSTSSDSVIAATGMEITSQQGSIPEVLNGLFLALSGQSFTAENGTTTLDLSTALIGIQSALSEGVLTAFVEYFIALTGVESTAVEGAVLALTEKVLTGSAVTANGGAVAFEKYYPLTGKQLTLSKGTPRHSVQIGATGYELAFSGGQIIYSVPLSSQLLTASKGAIKAVNDNTLSGSAIQVDAGATIAALSKMAVGQSIAVERGDTVATFTKSLANNLIIMSGKGEIVFDSRDVTIAMIGKTITTSEGTIYIGADKWYNFTRVLAGGTDVTIVHLA